ncbi:MAG: hypothetical protein ACP5UL_03095 [Thermoplasmata archaeon]
MISSVPVYYQVWYDSIFLVISFLTGYPLVNMGLKKELTISKYATIILSTYTGWFIFYIISYFPIPVVYSYVFYSITIVLSMYSIYLLIIHNINKKKFINLNKLGWKYYLYDIIAIILAIYIYLINADNVSHFITGNTMDTGYYSLLAEVILYNHSALIGTNPFFPGISPFPNGMMTILILYSFYTSLSVIQAPLLLTPFFEGMLILSFYVLGTKIKNNRMGIMMAIVSAFLCGWPQYLVTGSNDFIFSLPLGILMLSFSGDLFKVNIRQELLLLLLFGFDMAINPIFGIVTIPSIFIVAIVAKFFNERKIETNKILLMATSLLPILPSILLVFSPSPYGNAYQPQYQSISKTLSYINIFNLLYNTPYPIVNLEFLLLLLVGVAYILKSKKFKKTPILYYYSLTGIVVGILITISYYSFNVPILGSIINPTEVIFVFYMLISIFSGIGMVYLFEFIYKTKKRKLIAILVMLLLVIVPVAYSVNYESSILYHDYLLYSTTTNHDIQVMEWMKGKYPENTKILIEPGSGGAFIPSIDHYIVIYPPFAVKYNEDYSILVDLLCNNVINNETIKMLNIFQVSLIFVSDHHVGIVPWKYQTFMNNTNFTYLYNSGDTYLFMYKQAGQTLYSNA